MGKRTRHFAGCTNHIGCISINLCNCLYRQLLMGVSFPDLDLVEALLRESLRFSFEIVSLPVVLFKVRIMLLMIRLFDRC